MNHTIKKAIRKSEKNNNKDTLFTCFFCHMVYPDEQLLITHVLNYHNLKIKGFEDFKQTILNHLGDLLFFEKNDEIKNITAEGLLRISELKK